MRNLSLSRLFTAVFAQTLTCMCSKSFAAVDEGQPSRLYGSNEERREAGVRHVITDWLAVLGLAEIEITDERTRFRADQARMRDRNFSTQLQLGMDFTPLPWAKGELTLEYEQESSRRAHGPSIDEALAAFQFGTFELETGRLFLPFGEYFSHFASGPLLEFGETRGSAAVLSWSTDERFDVSFFAYRGRAETADASDGSWDLGFAASITPSDLLSVGASYIGDIADSEARLLQETDNRYQRRVAGASAYARLNLGRFEATIEGVRALSVFSEFAAEFDRPSAWNTELTYFPYDNFGVTLRREGSRELDDEPERQIGIALSWRIVTTASLTLEYLRGNYRQAEPDEDDEASQDEVKAFGVQLSIEF